MGPYNNSNNADTKKVARMPAIGTNPQWPLLAGSTHAPLCSKAAVQSKLLKLSLPTPQRVQMTFNDLERKRIENAMSSFMAKRRPPVHVRSQLDIGYRLVGQSIEIFETRPQWDDLSVIVERSFAKATYVKTQKLWKVFWMRSDLKWHGYKPVPTVSSIDEFVTAVDADPYCCFFG